MVTGVHVVPMLEQQGHAVLDIYAAGIASGNATFETEVPSWPAWDAAHLPEHRFVALDADPGVATQNVVGWAATRRTSERRVYAGVLELSIYVAEAARGRGVGRALLEALIASSEAAGVWTLQAGVFPENTASLALHARCGFRTLGVRERVGRHGDRWRDVVLLERRSRSVGR